MSRNCEDASETREQSESRVHQLLTRQIWWRNSKRVPSISAQTRVRWFSTFLEYGTSVYAFAFVLETDILSMRCKDDVTYYTFDNFETITASGFVAVQWLIKMYCVDNSICHFKFPKVAHIIGEVITFCTVLVAVSSRTCLPIFIEIDSYLTNTEQKICWHSFFETPCSVARVCRRFL